MSRGRNTWKLREARRPAATAAVRERPPVRARPARQAPAPSRPPSPPSTSPPRRAIAWLAAGIVGATLLGSGLVLLLLHIGDSAVPDDPGPPAVAPASTYRAVYRVDDTAGPQHQVQTDVVSVRRPDQVRVEHREGPPPGGAVISGSVVNREYRLALPEAVKEFATPVTLALEPEVFSEPALRAAVDAGTVEQRDQATVAGERCTRYLYRHSGSETLSRGNGQERVESCVTSDGVMLRESVTVAGRQVRLAEATALERTPRFGPDEFATPGEVPGTVTAAERVNEGRPSESVLHATAPTGFHRDRQLTDTRSEGDSPLMPFYVDSYAGGGEFAVVQQLMVRETANSPWTAAGGSEVGLGAGRTGQVLYHTGFVEVQTAVGGYPVRVLASRLDLALHVAGTLRT